MESAVKKASIASAPPAAAPPAAAATAPAAQRKSVHICQHKNAAIQRELAAVAAAAAAARQKKSKVQSQAQSQRKFHTEAKAHVQTAIQTQKDNIKDSPSRMIQWDSCMIPKNRYSNKTCQEKKPKERHHSMFYFTRDRFPSEAEHRQQMEILQREERRQINRELKLKENQCRRIEAESEPLKIEEKVCGHTEKKADESLSKDQQNDSIKLIGSEPVHSPGRDNDSKYADYFLKYTPPKQKEKDLERANELQRHDRIYELFWLDERREEEKYRRKLEQNDQEEIPNDCHKACRHRHHKPSYIARFDHMRPMEGDIQEADSSPERSRSL